MQTHHLPETVLRFLQHKNALQPRHRFLAAVSGGLDSVVLCELCRQAGLNFTIAHCNFGLRGEESERDEQFVRSLANRYGVEVLVKKFDTARYAEEKKLSIQEAARNLRYEWFYQLKKENDFAFTLLAHHADDNVETLLINFFRGTGLQGLTGIPEGSQEGSFLLRPLLSLRRKEIEAFALQNGLSWVEDSSNSSVAYTRNFLRHEIIPRLKTVFPQVEENLLDTIGRFKKINSLYQPAVQQLKQKICEPYQQGIRIPVLKLLKYKDTSLVYEIIRDFGFGEKQIPELVKLMAAESGKFMENDRYQIIRHRNWLIIAPKTPEGETVAVEKEEQQLRFSGGLLEIKFLSAEKFRLDTSAWVAQLDARHIVFPLILRRWKTGDYFYPLGLRKKKKLSRFFIDQKLPKNQKENIWVVESGKKIIWVAGMRIDDRFKVTASTKELLQLSLTSPSPGDTA